MAQTAISICIMKAVDKDTNTQNGMKLPYRGGGGNLCPPPPPQVMARHAFS